MDIEIASWYVSIACELFAALICLRRGLHRLYPWWFAYLCVGVAKSVALRALGSPRSSIAYAWAWIATEPLMACLLWLAARELVGLLPERLGAFGRSWMRRALDAAVLAALASTLIEAAGPTWDYSSHKIVPAIIILKRFATSALALYLLALVSLVVRFGKAFSRRLVMHSIGLAAYPPVVSGVMMYQILAEHGRGTELSNSIQSFGVAAVFVFWAVAVGFRKEKAQSNPRTASSEEIMGAESRYAELRQDVLNAFRARR